MQTRLPDVIHVIINNTNDDSPEIASHYAGPHTRMTPRASSTTVSRPRHRQEPRQEGRRAQLRLLPRRGLDFLLGVDGDTTPEPDAVEALVGEITSDDRIGGISAIYSIDDSALEGVMARFLIAGQRAQFSAFNMQNLLKGRNMAVLGGQFSIFSTRALRRVLHASSTSGRRGSTTARSRTRCSPCRSRAPASSPRSAPPRAPTWAA